MPVDRGVLVQPVVDRDSDVLSFPEPDQRARHRTVDHHRMAGASTDRERLLADLKRDILARKRRQGRPDAGRPALRPGGKQALHSKAESPKGSGAEQSPAVY